MESTRKHLRFPCSGSADVLEGARNRVWGQLGDISRGGFYVSTFGPLPVESTVQFTLDFEGEKVKGNGKVATSHPGVGMAVAIQELPQDEEAHLLAILQRLETSCMSAEADA